MTFLVTGFGKPFSVAGFGNWFLRDRYAITGLLGRRRGGEGNARLRGRSGRAWPKQGCSHSMIKAITGHKTDKEITRFHTAAADQSRLAERAMQAAYGMKPEHEVLTSMMGRQFDTLTIKEQGA